MGLGRGCELVPGCWVRGHQSNAIRVGFSLSILLYAVERWVDVRHPLEITMVQGQGMGRNDGPSVPKGAWA